MVIKVIVALVLITSGVYGGTWRNCNTSYLTNEDITRYNNEHIEKYSLIREVPRSDVLYRLWTRSQKNDYTPLYVGHLGKEDTIRPEQPFKFIIHGWTDCADSNWYKYFKNEYLSKGDYNIIMVDWSEPASEFYHYSAVYTSDVGKFVGELIVDLYKTHNIPLTNVHLIGHSLGSHVSGYAGKYVEKQTGSKIGRITAMDAAWPLFWNLECKERLCKTDAEFVDVIHTDGNKLGFKAAIGHADFYPNGGTFPQNGCLFYDVSDDFVVVVKGVVVAVANIVSCSHIRSYLLMGESINSDQFISHQCSSYQQFKNRECIKNNIALMGENASPNAAGTYYLSTNGESPFATNGEILST